MSRNVEPHVARMNTASGIATSPTPINATTVADSCSDLNASGNMP